MLPEGLLSKLPAVSSSASWLKSAWDVLHRLPGGRQLYSRFLATAIPHAASVDVLVVELGPGHCKVELKDERRVRNHLGSVHAIALAHVAELAANAALAYSLEDDMRFIPTEINIRYLKKAHGTITAECNCSPSFGRERQEVVLTVNLSDPEGNRVAEATQKVLIGPMPAS